MAVFSAEDSAKAKPLRLNTMASVSSTARNFFMEQTSFLLCKAWKRVPNPIERHVCYLTNDILAEAL